MSEITVTYTMEVTEIYKDCPDDLQPRKNMRRRLERILEEELGADDVHVRDLKLFIRDEEADTDD